MRDEMLNQKSKVRKQKNKHSRFLAFVRFVRFVNQFFNAEAQRSSGYWLEAIGYWTLIICANLCNLCNLWQKNLFVKFVQFVAKTFFVVSSFRALRALCGSTYPLHVLVLEYD
ncbi:hypothetical protein SE18_02950 [Herpetosiphon geysericola]|uniref:Uncharacterized protein n=1 Tax=Herpetosiphon geysericola TaxID=70996 RepID=A0A0P6YLY2_9CHLR|nr:hypothetical protein SE18_02950 [Herpetosiphon geysericola]